jgi:hypothetical protein
MLTQKLPYISIFKTNSGEEFIAKVLEETLTGFTIEKPLCMVSTQKGFSFAPFLMMADPEKNILVPKPVVQGSPAPQLQQQYESAVSGIALPQKSSIIS